LDNAAKLRQKILEKTRSGPLNEWVDRIGNLADNAGLKIEMINWNGSPLLVAHEVIKQANAHDVLDKLIQLTEEL
jgi:hypothetical protein